MLKNIITVISIGVLSTHQFVAQNITLENIYTGKYRIKNIAGISSLKNGDKYAVIENGAINTYHYKDASLAGTLAQGSFESYTLSQDESTILLLKQSQPIYRHSFLGIYEVKNLKTGKTFTLNNGQPVQEPSFSPDATKIAFIQDNNLYYQEVESGKITQITTDGKKNAIINGLADWVYEEEFGHARQYEWTKNSSAIVFVKSDESFVKEVNLPIYGQELYPFEFRFKYPKAGEENSKVSAHIYDLTTKNTSTINLANFKNYYLPNVIATKKDNEIILITSERTQNASDIIKINTNTGQAIKLFTETDEAWIDTDSPIIEFLEDNSFLWASERDGYRHLYWYDETGKLKKQATKGNWEITEFYGYDAKSKNIFVQTTEKGSINKVISKINLNSGKSTILSNLSGNNSGNFSKNFNYFIETSSTASKPYTFTLKDQNGKKVRELQNNTEVLQKLKADGFVEKEFFTITNEVGDQMNAWIMKPKNFDPNKKYPLFMYQYSGPGSQQVSNSWDNGNALWFNHLVQQGYIVACVDGRGTGYKGAKFKKSTYLNLGKYEIADQIYAAKWFGKQTYIDANRIGIFGWSFGGYMASLAMTKGADIFKMGIAVAPVTNWRFYDTVYTERFLRTPQENPTGYDENSPTSYAHLLKGKFLMIHGSADDNVHIQNAMVFSDALVAKNKDFDFIVYSDKDHGIYGGATRWQLYKKMTEFIKTSL